MDVVMVALLGVALYLVGSVPTAYILVRLVKGVDLREVGTKNVGALNTYHQIGAGAALLVLVVDAGKGALAVGVPLWADAPDWALFPTTLLVVAGHNWPVFLGFRGGKGAAAILGVSLALMPWLTLIALPPAALRRPPVTQRGFGLGVRVRPVKHPIGSDRPGPADGSYLPPPDCVGHRYLPVRHPGTHS